MAQRTHFTKKMVGLKKVAERLFNDHLREVIPERYPYYVQVLPGSLEDQVKVCVVSDYFRRIKSRIQRMEMLWEFVDRHLPPEQSTRLSIIGGYPIEEAVYYPFLDHSQWAKDGQPEQPKNRRQACSSNSSSVKA